MAVKKIYLDNHGYEEYLEEIQNLKEELKVNSREKAEAGNAAKGDGWHDNFDYEQAEREQRKNMNVLNEKIANIKNIVIIEPHGNSNLVDLGDFVKVELVNSGKVTRSRVVKLTGSLNPSVSGDVQEVTINSPMGRAIYEKEEGETVSCMAKDREIVVYIAAKAKSLEDLNKKVR